MAGNYIYKPAPSKPGKGPVLLAPAATNRADQSPVITGPDGTQYHGTFVNSVEGNHQYEFPTAVRNIKGGKINYGDQVFALENGSQSYEGSNFSDLQPRAKGSYDPNQIGYSFAPADLTGQFPDAHHATFKPVKTPRYDFTDPTKFAENFGNFNRGQIDLNFKQAQDIGLGAVDTELKGLQSFVPAASALKRSETSIDNVFNQNQRLAQIDQGSPGLRDSLAAQGGRAEDYAQGRLPSSIDDRALELGLRSQSADSSTSAGFGAQSSVARKASDLMSASQRLQIAQYGEGLLSSNLTQRANTLLAPTEYSNAGSQISINPQTNAGAASLNALNTVNGATLLSPGQALSSQIQQEQFRTGLRQSTNQFNASGQFQASQFNAGQDNQFAIGKFGYQVGYAGAVAGANQSNLNTQVGLAQQQQYADTVGQTQQQVQNSQAFGAGAQGIGTILAGASSILGALGAGGGQASGGGGGGSTVGGPSADPLSEGGLAPEGGFLSPDSYANSGSSYSSSPQLPSISPGGQISDIPPFSFGQYGGSGPSQGYSLGANTDLGFGSGGGATSNGAESYSGGPSGGADTVSYTGGGSGGGGGGQSFSVESAPLRAFSLTANIPEGHFTDPAINKGIVDQGQAVLQASGISNTPAPGNVNVGSDTTGRPVYSSQALLNSSDSSTGSGLVTGLKSVLDPFGVLSSEDSSTIAKVATIAGDGAFIANLTALQANGDTKGFISALTSRVTPALAKSLGAGEKTQETVGAAFSAYQLAQNWDRMSPAQKSLGIASLGIQGIKTATGTNLAQTPIIKPTLGVDGKVATPGLSVGQGLAFFQAGYNTYSLVKNWDQLNGFQKITGGTADAAAIANLAKSSGMLGAGTNGAAVANVTAESLASAGWSGASNLGVGAITSASGEALPAGYTVLSQAGGQTVAIPTANAATSSLGQAGNLLGTAGGVAGIAAGAYQVSKGWGQGGSQGAVNGALGGSAMAAGLYSLGATNPPLLAAVVAYSVAADATPHGTAGGAGFRISKEFLKGGISGGPIAAFGLAANAFGKEIRESTDSGKSRAQEGRDFVRNRFKEVGIIKGEDNFNVTLADGSNVDIGIDGHGGSHSITDPTKLLADQKDLKSLNSWDTDYTNDLDATAGMGGVTLSRLISGRTGTDVNQVGGQLGNALLGQDGFGKDYSPENFDKVAQNFRAVASQSGIKSKSDMIQLSNQAYAEGRINDTDLLSTQQTINMMYDPDGYKTGQQLMSGRFRGLEAGMSSASSAPKTEVTQPSTAGMPRKDLQVLPPIPGTESAVGKAPKKNLFDTPLKEALNTDVRGGASRKNIFDTSLEEAMNTDVRPPGVRPASLLSRSKEEVKRANKTKYQVPIEQAA